ncbi:deoxyguanosinetriphosphate triphosphohydrolase [Candidatus Peregrinibacteria bacterium]|nr:deoxyguanosinetriphosphate triphosphohydrolase [Candidatus Peregrinibacteria bacterium]
MLFDKKILERNEAGNLADYAVKSRESKGRKYMEEANDERLCFQRDKDRIIHCRAFRRLEAKTQVFIAGVGDHYRTRLTHTLEVAQISRDIARRLGLNEDLCEAVALAHDLGHPPFGHGGEESLNEVMKNYDMHFEHNEQSRRIVEKLEKLYPDFNGLNLTYEVLDGLIKHQTAWDQAGMEFEFSPHLEAQVVNVADEIAYINHDIDDGLRAGCINLGELDKNKLWKNAKKEVEEKYGKYLIKRVFISRMISSVISMMVEDFCTFTESNIQKNNINSVKDIQKFKGQLADFSPEMRNNCGKLSRFLYDNFYMNPEIGKFIKKGKNSIKRLFELYIDNPEKFPKKKKNINRDEFVITVKDYIAGMTDGFLMSNLLDLSHDLS